MKQRISGLLKEVRKPICVTLLVVVWPINDLVADEGLILIGYNASYFGDKAIDSGGGLSSDVFCGEDGVNAMVTANQAVFERVGGRIGNIDLPGQGELTGNAKAAQELLCASGQAFTLEPSAITYSSCRLTMDMQATLMDMRIPTSETAGAMDVADFWKAEVMTIPLYQSGSDEETASTSEWDASIDWSGPGDTRELAGYAATRWDYEYATTMSFGGGGSSGGEGFNLSMNMATTGYGYFSKDVPGFDLLEEFYQRFAEGISFEKGGGSLFGGLMNTWVEVLERGVPLEMDQTVSTSMAGMGSLSASSRSLLKVSSLQLADLPDDFCTMALTPDHFAVNDVGMGMSGMTVTPGGSPSGAGAEGQSGMSSLGGLMDMLNSAGQQGFAVPEQQQAPAANPAGQAAKRSGPSSSELMTDNVTQSVQLHLEALGYDVGNTSGDLDTTTIISISQFQAEKGMEVTGEVSPQLLGVLGAAVDAQ
jgi:hypothetical protein